MLGASLLLYSDTQGYGIAAIFKMIEDLGLYKIVFTDTVAAGYILDLNKYQLSTIMAALGSLAVSIRVLTMKFILTNATTSEPLSTTHNRSETSSRKILRIYVDMGRTNVTAFHHRKELLWYFGIEVRIAPQKFDPADTEEVLLRLQCCRHSTLCHHQRHVVEDE